MCSFKSDFNIDVEVKMWRVLLLLIKRNSKNEALSVIGGKQKIAHAGLLWGSQACMSPDTSDRSLMCANNKEMDWTGDHLLINNYAIATEENAVTIQINEYHKL